MRALAIMYHDVLADGDHDASGFPGKWADLYKLDKEQFARHLAAIRDVIGDRLPDLVEHREEWLARRAFFLTFDDGGVSAYGVTAGLLEQHGWRGHFFITTDRIETPGFLNHDQLRSLRQRGHVIGSHSCSHPKRISSCSDAELAHEWGESTKVLAGIVGEPIVAASVPGGFYSRRVAQAAAAAGIRYLFTSEPTDKTWIVEGYSAAILCNGTRLPSWLPILHEVVLFRARNRPLGGASRRQSRVRVALTSG